MIGISTGTMDAALRVLGERITAPAKVADEGFSFMGRPVAGIRVTKETAMTYSTFFACVRMISETVSQMPTHVFRRVGRYRFRVDPRRDPKDVIAADTILSVRANDEMGARTFKETRAVWAMLQGNSYAEIERMLNGRPVKAWPFDGARVRPDRDRKGTVVYVVKQGQAPEKTLPASKVFHLRGPSPDGLVGWSIPKLARESISLGLAMQAFGSSFFGNNCRPGIALETPQKLNAKARKRLRDEIVGAHGGAEKSFGTMILQQGMKLNTYEISAEDAQTLGSRKFQKAEVCQWFNMKLHKVAEMEGAKFNNIEAQNIEYVTDAVMPWATRIEEEANLKLIGKEQAEYFVRMNANQFMRGDSQKRAKWYDTLFKIGVYSINEIRSLEDDNPVGPAGDLRFVPLNMATLDQAYKDGNTAPKKAIPGGASNERVAQLTGPAAGAAANGVVSGDGQSTVAMIESPDGWKYPVQVARYSATPAGPAIPEEDVEKYRAAHRGVFESAAAWLVKKEGNAHARAATRYAGKADEFSSWQDTFFAKHLDEMVEAFSAPADAVAALLVDDTRSNESVEDLHQVLADACTVACSSGRADYRLAFGNLQVSELSSQRNVDVPAAIADQVMDAVVLQLRKE